MERYKGAVMEATGDIGRLRAEEFAVIRGECPQYEVTRRASRCD